MDMKRTCRSWLLMISGVVLAGAVGCSGQSGPPAPLPPRVEAGPAPQSVVKGNTAFALDLYARLRGMQFVGVDTLPLVPEVGNLFMSPVSISTALGMTYAGARGETAKQMVEVLHLPEDQAKAHEAFEALLGHLMQYKGENGPRVSIANALWGQQGYHFLPGFLKTVRERYGAGFSEVNFVESEEARKTINDWVAENTQDKIKNLIPEGVLGPITRLVLTNAIYFKGDWASPFKKHSTHTAPFKVSPGEEVRVPMMFQTGRFGYVKLNDLQVLEMNYRGGELSMVFLLPKKVDGLPALEKDLTPGNLDKWLAALRQTEVQVYVPKFETTAQFELKKVLAEMGMSSAFSPKGADFSGMTTEEELFISNVIHRAWVRVDEKGTEAAAATAAVAAYEGISRQPEVFRADRPFLFLIRDRKTGSILFLGRVVDPMKS